MPQRTEDISKIEDIGERLDALLEALETSSSEVARVGSDLDKPLEALLAETTASKPKPERTPPKPEQDAVAQDQPASGSPTDSVANETEPDAQPQPEAIEPEPEPDQAAPDDGDGATSDDDTTLDDGLLIEPETYTSRRTDDIDGAPVGPLDLEAELDHELESLLASGVFEDPLAEMGVDESAEPLELAEEPVAPIEPVAAVRKPNPPTDEAELIGELDEQLAALADAQLAEDSPPEATPSLGSPSAAEVESAPAPAAVPVAETKPDPAPVVVAQPVAPARPAARGWKPHADRALRALRPVAQRVAVRTGKLAVAGATRASAPLKDKPAVKQVVGWVALVHAFYAACIWVYLALWHNPAPPPVDTPQPTIVSPESG